MLSNRTALPLHAKTRAQWEHDMMYGAPAHRVAAAPSAPCSASNRLPKPASSPSASSSSSTVEEASSSSASSSSSSSSASSASEDEESGGGTAQSEAGPAVVDPDSDRGAVTAAARLPTVETKVQWLVSKGAQPRIHHRVDLGKDRMASACKPQRNLCPLDSGEGWEAAKLTGAQT